jgi:hypothetical protein
MNLKESTGIICSYLGQYPDICVVELAKWRTGLAETSVKDDHRNVDIKNMRDLLTTQT